ncbi:serine hydrolase domain-containing protein [Poriferisphaera sp. WC338]|uniref:serine hydrolase domain-containing protein n=1 Tax=Poriferisphaera sp. WC338 TaxID=3425129 RepID=UPI003D817809
MSIYRYKENMTYCFLITMLLGTIITPSVFAKTDGTADETATLNVVSKFSFVDREKFVERGQIEYTIPVKLTDNLSIGDAREYGNLTNIVAYLNQIEKNNQQFRIGKGVPNKQHKVNRKWAPKVVGNIDSILIAKDGKLILEEYFADAHIDRPHYQMSITKSIMSHAIGKAIELGKISSEDASILKYLPEVDVRNIAVGADQITIRDLLTMSSGIRYKPKDRKSRINKNNHAELYLSLTTPIPNSKTYKYDGANLDILSHILYNTTGMKLSEFCDTYLFGPMGIKQYSFGKSVCGLEKAAAGMKLRSRDMLKIGLMTAHQGQWNDKQILNSEWIKKATAIHTNHDQPHQYGYFWWSNTINVKGKTFRVRSARGAGGQFIFMIPEIDLITVYTSYYATNKPIQDFANIIVPLFVK